MASKFRVVVSASRRTDIPAFYMPWFMDRVDKGRVAVVNPFNQQEKIIKLTFDSVHSIVFWSKNYGAFLKGRYGEQLKEKGFNLFFHFTINSPSAHIERTMPAIEDRFRQLNALCQKHGADSVTWRFDPICFFEVNGKKKNNLYDFRKIAENVANSGVTRCITSFRDDYRKVDRRTKAMTGFCFIDVSFDEKTHVLRRMNGFLKTRGMTLAACCEKEILAALPPGDTVASAACIDHQLLEKLFGGHLNGHKDVGQRSKLGCGCHRSVDVGDYRQHPCYHNCLYCFANPSCQTENNQRKPLIGATR